MKEALKYLGNMLSIVLMIGAGFMGLVEFAIGALKMEPEIKEE